LKLTFGSINARERFLYLLNLLFSSLESLWFQFSVFIAHSTKAFIKSSLAGESNARLAWGLASLSTWRKCSCDFNRFITSNRFKHFCSFPGNIFVLNLKRSLMSSLRINTIANLYTLLGTSCENWKCFRGRLVGPSAQFDSCLFDF